MFLIVINFATIHHITANEKMKAKLFIIGIACLLLLVFFCMPIPVKKIPEGGPTIRVGLVEHLDKITISVDGAFQITDALGSRLAVNMNGGEWEVQITGGKASRTIYRLLALSTPELSKAEELLEDLKFKGYPADVVTIGRKISETTHIPSARRGIWFDSENEYRSPGKEIADNRVYHVYLQRAFSRKSDADEYQKQLNRYVETTVRESYQGDASGTIIMNSLSGGADYNFKETIKIVGSMVTIKDFSPKSNEKWDGTESRTYRGDMEFRIDDKGKLTVINELPVEVYLRGVVSSEMSVSFPLEALKAQAVAARSNVMRKIGIYHQEQHFDVCDDEHCQVYRGTVREAIPTDQAVAETHGTVLIYEDKICDAPFFSTCGGHTENNDNVWSGEPVPHLRGVLDSEMRKDLLEGKFESEAFVWTWLNDAQNAKVYCNTLSEDIPIYLKTYAKYFRWELNYTQNELAQLIRKKTGENVGELKNIIPLKRGVSGRIMKLKIEGTRKELILEKELNIRDALGEPRLYSSCFAVQRLGIVGDIPGEFVIKGAGYGHGVGMCQVGAAGMALAGKKYDDILKHYYTGVEVTMIY